MLVSNVKHVASHCATESSKSKPEIWGPLLRSSLEILLAGLHEGADDRGRLLLHVVCGVVSEKPHVDHTLKLLLGLRKLLALCHAVAPTLVIAGVGRSSEQLELEASRIHALNHPIERIGTERLDPELQAVEDW